MNELADEFNAGLCDMIGSSKMISILTEDTFMLQVINAFALQNDPEYKGKVITRLQNIGTVHKQLQTCLAGQ